MGTVKNNTCKTGLRITLDFNNLMAESAQGEGLTERELSGTSERARQILKEMQERRAQGQLPFMDLPYQGSMVKEIKEYGRTVKGKFADLVILGIGGSALGGITLHHALHPPFYNLLPLGKRKGWPRIFFAENIDPD